VRNAGRQSRLLSFIKTEAKKTNAKPIVKAAHGHTKERNTKILLLEQRKIVLGLFVNTV
jgi:hypothetical protein